MPDNNSSQATMALWAVKNNWNQLFALFKKEPGSAQTWDFAKQPRDEDSHSLMGLTGANCSTRIRLADIQIKPVHSQDTAKAVWESRMYQARFQASVIELSKSAVTECNINLELFIVRLCDVFFVHVYQKCFEPYLLSLPVLKFEFILGAGGLSFSCPGCDLIWCQYPEFSTAVLQTGQFA